MMEQVFSKAGNSDRGLMWLGMVLGSLMVCPKLLSNLPSWEIDEKDGKSRQREQYQ